MYRPIGDYGAIGNLRTVALVSRAGSIDWLCLPDLDSPSVFGALLDDARGGRFALVPTGDYEPAAEYLPGTNVLVTRFVTAAGETELTDFMPVLAAATGKGRVAEIFRRVRQTRGAAEIALIFDPRFDYARGETRLAWEADRVEARGGGGRLVLAVSRAFDGRTGETSASWKLATGDELWLRLALDPAGGLPCACGDGEAALAATAVYWQSWLGRRETGRSLDLGGFRPLVDRSALVLKLLSYVDTGAIAAAATTSLPEQIGGERNWDYRYSWVRDSSFTLQALFNLGHLSETEAFLRWLERIIGASGAARLQIMYGLRGEENLPEAELGHLEGYRGSRPVRIGNDAAGQRQHDIYGEVMDAALRLADYVGRIDYGLWPVLRGLCEQAIARWAEPDSGIWEVRGGPRHFVHSKVMCWVALDRGLAIAERYGFPADRERWQRARAAIRADVIERGWSPAKGAFVQAFGSEALDATALLLPLLGFLPFDDPRVASTVAAVERELGEQGFLLRYRAADGLDSGEGGFLLCSFWHADCLVGLGRLEEAERLLRRLEAAANHLGLFSEEHDPATGEALGNFPQAFTHIGYVNSVVRLAAARALASEPPPPPRRPLLRRIFPPRRVLNDADGSGGGPKIPATELAAGLKERMNVLRGAFFDSARGRVAYERMAGSAAYADYLALARRLPGMDLDGLTDRRERIAFWVNLFNVMVIHGVVALGIRDSVQEVRDFFGAVRYRIGPHLFSPSDIEHGILRGNRRPPHSLRPLFGVRDPRRTLRVDPPDPRTHFALVCASSSCPPIAVYTAAGLDEELEISARTFVNAGGVRIDRARGRVALSRVFDWYGADFGDNAAAVLRFVAPFFYDERDRDFLLENADALRVRYQAYDWRLNRAAAANSPGLR